MFGINDDAEMYLSLATYNFGEIGLQPLMKQFSPRSVEAMKRHGLFPKELAYRDVSYFEKPGEDVALEILQLRWNHYEKKRLSRLKACKIERATIVKEQNFRMEFARKSFKKLPLSPVAATEESSAEAIASREKKTLDALQKRQQSEFQQLFQSEIAKQITEATKNEKQKRAQRREMQRNQEVTSQREKWRAAKEEREKRRLKEQRKQEEVVRRRRYQTDENAKRQIVLEEHEKKKEMERNKHRAQTLEEQRLQRQRKMDEKLDALHQQAMEKQKEIDQREKARQEKLKRMRQDRMAEAKAEQRRQQKRLQRIQKEKSRKDEQRKKAIQRKEKEQERRRMEFELEKRSLIERKRQIQLEKERRMRRIKQKMLEDEEDKRRSFQLKQRIINERLQLRKSRPNSAKSKRSEGTDRQRKIKRQQKTLELKLKDNLTHKMKSSELHIEKLTKEREAERLKREEMKKLRKKDRIETITRMKRIEAFKLSKLTEGISKKKRQLRELDRLKKAAESKRIAIRGRSESQRKILESAMAKLKKSDFEIETVELSRGVDLLSLMKKAGVKLTPDERKVIKSIPASQDLTRKGITPNTSHRPSSAPPKRPRRMTDTGVRTANSMAERKIPQRPSSATRRPRPQSARPKQRYQEKGRRSNVGAIEAERRIDNIKRKLSMQMLSVLEEEQMKEEERAQILNGPASLTHQREAAVFPTGIPDAQEKTRMDTILGYERAKASKRIQDLQEEQARILREELEIHLKII